MSPRLSLGRIAAVTGALIGVGAVCGAVIGALLVLMGEARGLGEPGDIPGLARSMAWGATWGAPLGAVFTPILAWIFLRRVALGRALVETAIGTLAGAAIALAIAPFWFFAGAIVGFVAAAVRLFVVTRRRTSAAPPAG